VQKEVTKQRSNKYKQHIAMRPFNKGSTLSKQSVSYMDRVSEHVSDADEDPIEESSQVRVTSTTSHDDAKESSVSFSLARSETRRLRRSKAALLLAVAIFTVSMGIMTYFVVLQGETTQYHDRVSCANRSSSSG
jgi:hypothetical protein